MKPLEGGTMLEGDGSSDELEFEMPSKQFFQDVGMLVVEGRIPHSSDKGRIEGPHCPSVLGTHSHVCDTVNKFLCQLASGRLQKMESLWQHDVQMFIDVYVDVSDSSGLDGRNGCHTKQMILVERWKVECKSRNQNSAASTSAHMLLQAIRSNIHFSQLSAWLSSSKGAFPRNIHYRIYGKEDHSTDTCTFLESPKHHVFPLATLPNNAVLLVEVFALPRYDLCELWHILCACSNICNHCAVPCKIPNDRETSQSCNSVVLNQTPEKLAVLSPLRKKPFQIEKSSSSDNDIATAISQVGQISNARTCKTIQKLDSSACQKPGRNCHGFEVSSCLQQLQADKEQAAIRELISNNEDHCVRTLQELKILSRNKGQKDSVKTSAIPTAKSGVSDFNYQHHKGGLCGSPSQSNDVNIPKPNDKLLQQMIHRRTVPLKSCTIPIFNSKTGLPISSSPALLRRSTTELCEHHSKDMMISDSLTKPEYRDLAKVLSKSAPASTALSGLLGNFEESVLNGRMEPVGTVQGFTAELGASGTFCPSHVMLPITAYFFRLSDDDAPSPYMGYIELDEPLVGKRGYHVPRKGTIQLTVFNPNKTVLKVFVVLYNFADMPPKSQTFLRQRTFSVCKADAGREAQTTLHYLVHLRFKSSKSGKIYLHTDIRVIFSRQPPDFDGHPDWDVRTVTDGPTNPRYTPRNHDL